MSFKRTFGLVANYGSSSESENEETKAIAGKKSKQAIKDAPDASESVDNDMAGQKKVVSWLGQQTSHAL